MRFEYVCRYCKRPIGAVDAANWTYADAVQRLGLHHLDSDHQRDVIQSRAGDVQIQTVCEACEQAVAMNPELLIEGNVIQ
ncbi:anti-sigma-F factor Fin [Alicyclobacillus acidiphilus]|uniref:anti-sigma-F factor Fin n=1 Tax=Alicyclobacillus acidiphilus TaxID=182455 RepID=UPI00082DE1D1|nr:anti-sigma-F factor Fin [Alicyclobacillus acidiphilus]